MSDLRQENHGVEVARTATSTGNTENPDIISYSRVFPAGVCKATFSGLECRCMTDDAFGASWWLHGERRVKRCCPLAALVLCVARTSGLM